MGVANPKFSPRAYARELLTIPEPHHFKYTCSAPAMPSIDTSIPIETKDKMNNILLGNGMYGGCIQLNENVAYSPSRIWSQKPDCSVADQEINPLFLQNQKKINTTRSPSPEYVEVVSKDRHQGKGMQEQHYYHSTSGHYYSSITEIDEPNSY